MSKNKKKKAVKKPAAKAPKKSAKPAPKAVSKKISAKASKTSVKGADLKGKSKKEVAPIKEKITGKSKPGSEKPNLHVVPEAVAEEVIEEVALTNADGKRYCKVHDCDEVEAIDSYCRLHYIMFWKRNKTKSKILEGGKLDKYIEELTARYPDKYLEMLKKDLASEKDFNGIISEMDAEDASEDSDSEEDDNRFIEEVRGTVPAGPGDDDESF